MREHYFKKTDRVKFIPSANVNYSIWRCDHCDSEMAFPTSVSSEMNVNKWVIIKWPRMLCISREANL